MYRPYRPHYPTLLPPTLLHFLNYVLLTKIRFARTFGRFCLPRDQPSRNTLTAMTSDSVGKWKETREHAEGNTSPVAAEEALNGLDETGGRRPRWQPAIIMTLAKYAHTRATNK